MLPNWLLRIDRWFAEIVKHRSLSLVSQTPTQSHGKHKDNIKELGIEKRGGVGVGNSKFGKEKKG